MNTCLEKLGQNKEGEIHLNFELMSRGLSKVSPLNFAVLGL